MCSARHRDPKVDACTQPYLASASADVATRAHRCILLTFRTRSCCACASSARFFLCNCLRELNAYRCYRCCPLPMLCSGRHYGAARFYPMAQALLFLPGPLVIWAVRRWERTDVGTTHSRALRKIVVANITTSISIAAMVRFAERACAHQVMPLAACH
jgi:hypothetical protein